MLQLILERKDSRGKPLLISDLDAVAEEHARPWKDEWEVQNELLYSMETSCIVETREKYKDQARHFAEEVDLCPAAIRKACGSFSGKTAIGIDGVCFKTIGALPEVALEVLGALLKDAMAILVLPMQCLLNIKVLLGKPGGGSRTVAIIASFYRLLMRLVGGSIRQWDAKSAGHWDSAIKGSTALQAQLARALDVELAKAEGKHSVHMLWDMRKFFDSVRIQKLIPHLERLGYPPSIMVLGFIMHKAPRILKVGVGCSKILGAIARSMLAGCQQSVSWTRGLLYEMVEGLGYVLPGSVADQHVDDLSQVMVHKSRMVLVNAATKCGKKVSDGV